jgi:hypothetical protein
MGTTGETNIYSGVLNSLNSIISFSAYNTLDLASVSSLTVTGQSSINITSSNLNLNTSNINITNPQTLVYASTLGLLTDAVGGFYSSFFVFNQSEYGSGLVLEKDTAQLYGISTVTLQSDVKVDVFSPSTIFQGDVRALTFNGLPLPTSGGGGSVTSTFNQLYAYQLSNNPTVGSGAMGILAATQIDMLAPTIQVNAQDYLLFASNSFTQSSNTRLQGSNTIAIYNGALPAVADGGVTVQATNTLNLNGASVLVNGAPIVTTVTSTFNQLYAYQLSNNPTIGSGAMGILASSAFTALANSLASCTFCRDSNWESMWMPTTPFAISQS